jgi:hypothetical protein
VRLDALGLLLSGLAGQGFCLIFQDRYTISTRTENQKIASVYPICVDHLYLYILHIILGYCFARGGGRGGHRKAVIVLARSPIIESANKEKE